MSADEKLRIAANQLAESQRGRDAMKTLHDWITDHGLGLDAQNQVAVLTLLYGAWGSHAGTTREIMQEVLASWP